MIFQEKCFPYYILITDQMSLSDCLYFLRFWAICVLQLLVNQDVTSQILKLTLFLIKPFLYINQKSRQKVKYYEKEKRF